MSDQHDYLALDWVKGEIQETLNQASSLARSLSDEFVSTEHLLLAILKVKSEATRTLTDAGVKRKDLLKGLEALRGSARVTSQNPEAQTQALEKYGKDLTDLAKQGKLDPVIGRDDEIVRLDISVDHALFVSMLQTVGYLANNVCRFLGIQRTIRSDAFIQRFSFHNKTLDFIEIL